MRKTQPFGMLVCVCLCVCLLHGCVGGSAPAPTLNFSGTQSVDAGQSVNLTSNEDVTWALTSGPGTLSNQTKRSVTYNAPAAGTFVIPRAKGNSIPLAASSTATAVITATSGSKSTVLTITTTLPPSITTTTLPNGVVGTAYNQTVAVTGGAGTLMFTLSAGTLPNGLTLSSAGAITGTPTAVGTATFTVKVTDSSIGSPQSATQQLSITVNAAPAITSANSVTFVVGTAGTFTVTATGTPTPALTETGALPSGVTFVDNGNGTATLSGTPAAGTAANYPITFTANNGVGAAATQNFTLTVGQPAAITSASSTTFITSTAGTFAVTTTGFPAPSLTETGALPTGVTFKDNGNGTATLSGTPGANAGGTYSLSIKAHNGIGADATQSFTLTVNQTPAITSANKTTFTVGAAGTFTVTTSGFPVPSIAESGALPSGVTFVDNHNGTGTLAGIPGPGTAANYPITFTPSNGIGSPAAQSFTLTIGQAPAITSANSTTFTVGAAGTFSVTTTGFPAPALTESGALPTGVTFKDNGNGTATLSGTPAAGTGKTYAIMFTAGNGVGSNATQNFTLTINEAPSITSANSATFSVGAAGTFTVTATGFPAPSLTESGALPTGVSFNTTTGVLSGTPAAGTAGSYPITFTATNGVGANAVQNFTLTVDQAPAITSANSTTFTVGTAGSFTVTATGVPTPTLSEAGTLPNGVTFTSSTGVLSGTPAAGTGGVYPITFTAANGVGANAVQNFTLTVDQAPTITSANSTTFTVGAAGTFTVTATGPPAPAITESGTLPTGVTFTDNGNGTGTLSGTPASGSLGTFSITFTASNGISPNATQNFTLTVDTAPVFTSATSTTFTVGAAGTFTVTATGTPTPTLSESGALPNGVTFTASTGVLAGTPAAGTGGAYPVKFTASNGVGTNAVQNFTLTVNQAPAITSANNTTFTVGAAGSFTVTATGFPAPTFTETGALPTGVTLSTAGVLSGTPAAGTGGTYPITITAANGVGTNATQNFTLTVNTAPVITSANATTFTVGTAGSFTVTATGTPTPTLSESGTLPNGVTFTASTGVLAGTPAAGTGGAYPITFTASNGAGTNAVQSFTLTVDEAPKITSANNATFIANTAGSFTVTASGFPASTFSELGALPPGVTLSANGVLSGTATATGTFPITFTASNGIAPNATQSFTLSVTAAPAVVSTSVANFTVPFFAGNPGTTITIKVTNDAVGDVLTATLTTDFNTTFNCTTATCGTLGPVVGTSGSGSYTVSYTPPSSTLGFIQTVPTLVVNSSLPGAIGSTDFIEVDPPGILVQVSGPAQPALGGTVFVGATPADTRTFIVFIYNDTTQRGVTFAPLTAGGYSCLYLSPNTCGTLGTPTAPTYTTDTSTGTPVSVGSLTIPYTAPPVLPVAPFNTPSVQAISVADNTRSASGAFLLANDPTPPNLPSFFIFRNSKINTALIGTPRTVRATILNDTGALKTVNWTLTAGGVSCSPACGALGSPTVTVTGTTVNSRITYTPPPSVPAGASATPTITAASADTPSETDSFSFSIFDPTCGTGNEKVLNGQYAFLVRGGAASGGHVVWIGSFTADGAGHVTGGLLDNNSSNFGLFLNATLLTAPQGQLAASSYSVGADNRGCLTLTDSTGGFHQFRFAVGTPVTVNGVSVATQGRIISFVEGVGGWLNPSQSGVLYRQDPTSFNASALSGTYADGFVGVDSNGGRFADAGVFTANGAGSLTGISADLDDVTTAGAVTGTLTGTGTYTLATNAPGGRGTVTTSNTITTASGTTTSTGHSVFYMISSSHALLMTTDLTSIGQPIQSGEIRKQTGPFTATTLDNKNYVFNLQGIGSSGENDAELAQLTFTTNGNATLTLDDNIGGMLSSKVGQSITLVIAANGRATITGTGAGNHPPIVYLIDSTSGFLVGTSGAVESGFGEQQTGGPFSTASINGSFFFGGDAPTTAQTYDSGSAIFDGAGHVNGNDDHTGSNGLGTNIISGAYSFTTSSVPQGKGTVGNNSIAYVISGSKLVFMSTGANAEIYIIQK